MAEADRPLLRVVRGTPDDVELAALTAVVAGLASRTVDEPAADTSRWANRAARHRAMPQPGAGAWRTSFLPQ